jgi:hypothetical protein
MAILQDFKGEVRLSLTLTNKNDIKALESLTDELLDVTIKKHRNKKTLTQLGALFALCSELAKKLNSTKLEIYQHAVREVGEFIQVPLTEEDAPNFISTWTEKSESAQCIEFRDSKLDGYKVYNCYFSVATYDTKQMSILIDYIVEEAREQDIYLYTSEDIRRLK